MKAAPIISARTSAIGSLRTIASAALLGAVTAGVLFGWAPVAGVHEVGAVLGAVLGAVARAKHFI